MPPELPAELTDLRALMHKGEQRIAAMVAAEPHMTEPRLARLEVLRAVGDLQADLVGWMRTYFTPGNRRRMVSPADADELRRLVDGV